MMVKEYVPRRGVHRTQYVPMTSLALDVRWVKELGGVCIKGDFVVNEGLSIVAVLLPDGYGVLSRDEISARTPDHFSQIESVVRQLKHDVFNAFDKTQDLISAETHFQELQQMLVALKKQTYCAFQAVYVSEQDSRTEKRAMFKSVEVVSSPATLNSLQVTISKIVWHFYKITHSGQPKGYVVFDPIITKLFSNWSSHWYKPEQCGAFNISKTK